jgi:acetyltransferase-like isoleucine patch superfamily enzyme
VPPRDTIQTQPEPPLTTNGSHHAKVTADAPAVHIPLPAPPASEILPLRTAPGPMHGGPLAFWRFARRHNMTRLAYLPLIARWAWLKLRYRGRFVTDGLCFILPGTKFEIGADAKVVMGRWSWIGNDCKVRVHEGVLEIGAKTVLGQECTLSCFQSISIGRECIIADRVMMLDFDHGVVDAERPIREQGIYKRDVRVGHNCWLGYGACILRGVTVGDNSVIGTNTVVTKDLPDNAVAAGAPARVIRLRDAPQTFRWG